MKKLEFTSIMVDVRGEFYFVSQKIPNGVRTRGVDEVLRPISDAILSVRRAVNRALRTSMK